MDSQVDEGAGTPAISLVMTAYNAEATIAESIQSIIDQSIGGWELIVVDDGSDDRTAEIARSFDDPRIHLVEPGRLGRPAAFNVGVGNAAAPLIAVQDADDISLPDRLERQLQAYAAHPEADVVAGQVRAFWEERSWALTGPTTHRAIVARLDAGDMPIAHCTASFRRAWFDAQGGLDTSFDRYEDFDLYRRARATTQFVVLPDVLVRYRFRTASWSRWSADDRFHERAAGGRFTRQPQWLRYSRYRLAVWTQKRGLPLTRSVLRARST